MIFGLDPMLSGHLDWGVFGIVVLKTVLVFVFLLVATMFMVWFERKIIGDMQNRLGPNRAGPYGLLQTLADGTKLLFKEDLVPARADRVAFAIAPMLALFPAFLTFSVIPIGGLFNDSHGGLVSIFGHYTRLQLADPPIGFLMVLAMTSIAVYGVILAGWASGSKYPLLGSVRATAQMVSYEAAMGLSVAAIFLVTAGQANGIRALETSSIVFAQHTWHWNLWITGIVPAVIFLLAGTAEIERPPFDLLEAEQELVAGFNTEYSSFRFALFYLASFMNSVTFAAVLTTLFLGGPSGPSFGPEFLKVWILPVVWFFAKVLVLLYGFVWVRATLPRFRYDQLMDLGWKVLIPLSLGWLLLLIGVRVGHDRNWNVALVILVGVVVLLAGYAALAAANRVARTHRLEHEEAFE
ncbi:MAG TPA: complex I subunit 1 family protein [Acidimicrobiales bacterium]|jgi:NADH-quinone oxidoreductase subunit H|nr:complex I subunit 1 family protein [Acidimicrobiales bacterium]